jgi:hypothetical protein
MPRFVFVLFFLLPMACSTKENHVNFYYKFQYDLLRASYQLHASYLENIALGDSMLTAMQDVVAMEYPEFLSKHAYFLTREEELYLSLKGTADLFVIKDSLLEDMNRIMEIADGAVQHMDSTVEHVHQSLEEIKKR